MKNIIYRSFLFFSILLTQICFSTEDSSFQKAVAVKVVPYYSEARRELLPKGYMQKGDTCIIKDIHIDTMGIPWFGIDKSEKRLWSPAKYWRYISEVDSQSFAQGRQDEEERKRRLRILRDHRDWPIRIIRAVREGKICIDMNEEQLIASWGEPVQKSSAFTIGIGNHSIWIYSDKKGNIPVVIMENRKIIGWSKK